MDTLGWPVSARKQFVVVWEQHLLGKGGYVLPEAHGMKEATAFGRMSPRPWAQVEFGLCQVIW